MVPIFMEILLRSNSFKKIIQKDSNFNLEEWIKRRYSDPLKKVYTETRRKNVRKYDEWSIADIRLD